MLSAKFKTFRLLIPGVAAASLMLNTGCGVLPHAQQTPDHVFSSAIPQKTEERHADRSSAPVAAHYPDTLSYNTTPDPTDGVIRMNVKPTLIDGDISKAATFPIDTTEPSSNVARTRSLNQIQLVSFQAVEGETVDEAGPKFIPAEPRHESVLPEQQSNRMDTIAASPYADYFPDEYIFDGGDRDAPSGYVDGQRSGFDTEDTVAKFVDHTGDARTSPSNRIAVYAPRFGSVRTVTTLVADTKVDKAAGARDAQSVGNIKIGNAAQENVHDTILSGLESRNRVDGMASATPPMQARRTDVIEEQRKVDEGHEGRQYSSSGAMQRNQAFVLQQQIQNAIAWTRNDYPVLTASTISASKIKATLKVQQTIGVEDERKTKGQIHVVKLADRDMAQSGDTITFTIQFQNTGDFDVFDVSIVDNLTPRLDYLPGTAKIDGDHPGEVVIEDNGEGSKVLTFNLDNALKGHDAGEITFEARVR